MPENCGGVVLSEQIFFYEEEAPKPHGCDHYIPLPTVVKNDQLASQILVPMLVAVYEIEGMATRHRFESGSGFHNTEERRGYLYKFIGVMLK